MTLTNAYESLAEDLKKYSDNCITINDIKAENIAYFNLDE